MSRVAYIEDMMPVMKGRATDMPSLTGSAVTPAGTVFDAILYPNRSLSNAGFWVVTSIVFSANLIFGTFFYLQGAWPVLGFCALDVLLVWAAFKISYRQARLHERIRVNEDEILVSRVSPSGHEVRWAMQPFWTSVNIDRPVVHESQVRFRSKGKTLIVGAFLSPAERGELADALINALNIVRNQNQIR